MPKLKGSPIPILLLKEGGYVLDESALGKILLHKDVKDRNIVVVSVTGDYRKGKSFLLGYFLRYLNYYYDYKEPAGPENAWMGKADEPLEGFSWRYGSKAHTMGIWMWSHVFLATLNGEEKVGILLLDTQGAFDSDSSFRQTATVFALSTMVSSCQCYNLSRNIQENDVNNLQFFTEYGRLALQQDGGQRAFQKLLFIVRDWQFPSEKSYGEVGGRQLLEERLQVKKGMPEEHEVIRKHIKSCFADINCFLMPYPGEKIVDSKYNGSLSGLAPDFRVHLSKLGPLIFAPDKLAAKEINGKKIKAQDLIRYFNSYVKVLSSDQLPEPKTLYLATAEANNLSALNEARDTYKKLMKEIVSSPNAQYVDSDTLHAEHLRLKRIATDQFNEAMKMGGTEFSQKYGERLEMDLEELYSKFEKKNRKRKNESWKSAVLYAGVVVSFYVLTGILGRIGMQRLANFCQAMVRITFVSLITWSYMMFRRWEVTR